MLASTKLLYKNSFPAKIILRIILFIKGCELPSKQNIGRKVRFPHGFNGIVLHPSTIIKDRVTIFHQVTTGRGDMYNIDPMVKRTDFKGIILDEGAVICVGAKIICNRGTLVVGKNTIIAANAVLTKSTGDNEIWGGVPARLIKKRSLE